MGTFRDIVDEAGVLIDHIEYDSFGNIISETNAAAGDRFKFTGREWDAETGLYYYRARYFDPTLGRFISQDPIGFAGGDANLYRYVGNSPLIFVDPSGLVASLEEAVVIKGSTIRTLAISGAFVGFACGYLEAKYLNETYGANIDPFKAGLEAAALGAIAAPVIGTTLMMAPSAWHLGALFGALGGALLYVTSPDSNVLTLRVTCVLVESIAAAAIAGRIGAQPLKPKADAPQAKLRSDIPDHLRLRDTTVARSKGIGGAHNLDEFNAAATVDNIRITNRTPHPTQAGIEKIEYQIPAWMPREIRQEDIRRRSLKRLSMIQG